jgi:hypothetical protein
MSESKDKLGDLFKKVLTTGVNAAFMTEESIRALLKDPSLSKEMIGSLLENAKNTKTEFLGSIKNELKTYLDKIDVSKEIDRVIENYDVEVNAKVSFKKKKKAKSTDDN